MVQGMFPAPMVIGCETQDAANEAQNIIRFLRLEKRAMSAVVENNKHAHQKPPRQKGQCSRKPIRNPQTDVHQIPERRVRNQSVDELPERSPEGRLLVTGHNLLPAWSCRFLFTSGRNRIIYHKYAGASKGAQVGERPGRRSCFSTSDFIRLVSWPLSERITMTASRWSIHKPANVFIVFSFVVGLQSGGNAFNAP